MSQGEVRRRRNANGLIESAPCVPSGSDGRAHAQTGSQSRVQSLAQHRVLSKLEPFLRRAIDQLAPYLSSATETWAISRIWVPPRPIYPSSPTSYSICWPTQSSSRRTVARSGSRSARAWGDRPDRMASERPRSGGFRGRTSHTCSSRSSRDSIPPPLVGRLPVRQGRNRAGTSARQDLSGVARGSVEVLSTSGIGSTFAFLLPRFQAQ